MSLILVTPPVFFFLGGSGGLRAPNCKLKGNHYFFDSRVCVWFIIVCLVGVYNC